MNDGSAFSRVFLSHFSLSRVSSSSPRQEVACESLTGLHRAGSISSFESSLPCAADKRWKDFFGVCSTLSSRKQWASLVYDCLLFSLLFVFYIFPLFERSASLFVLFSIFQLCPTVSVYRSSRRSKVFLTVSSALYVKKGTNTLYYLLLSLLSLHFL